ncbi:AraC family transcriptional regulator [Paenibacillus spongiae]|uniref:Helix-turn-helix domain-containing protein n=1 Tax=Paenibacillus spongiae TaxID=2909671 RepID=A0ABY5S4W2_9BACL|nr:helix-turn-helix domain-containing protein [Paenibacillus spongiae]UVI27783.1 helix-turn-helix domain-containing protein [Paenibacillus spongiae]
MNPTNNAHRKGILHPGIGDTKFSLDRFPPSIETGFFIQNYWIIQWDLRGQAPYRQTVISHPNVNMVIEKDKTRIYGISSATYSQLLQDQGWVVGIKFKPGGFYPFWSAPVSRLTNKSIDVEDVFDVNGLSLSDDILQSQDDIGLAAQRIDSFFRERLPQQDSNVEYICELVYRIRDDRSIRQVNDAVRISGLHQRTLQRLFDRYVGASPKWVILRYRLHEAVERMSQAGSQDWTGLSHDLGYYDQSHFIRDFKSIIGLSPEEYLHANVGQ